MRILLKKTMTKSGVATLTEMLSTLIEMPNWRENSQNSSASILKIWTLHPAVIKMWALQWGMREGAWETKKTTPTLPGNVVFNRLCYNEFFIHSLNPRTHKHKLILVSLSHTILWNFMCILYNWSMIAVCRDNILQKGTCQYMWCWL